MKSKMLKRAIAIMLCMVIVMGGAEHMRAGSSEGTEETTTETAEEEIVLSDDGDENPVADAEEGQPKAQTEETPSEEGQSESKAEEGQSESKAEEGQSGPKVEEGQSGAQNPDAGETKTGESEENIPEEERKEKPIMELTYENSQVSIRVTADEEGNIPQGASLSVTPIEKQEIHDDMDADAKAEAEELNAQYDATAEKLQEKAQGEEYDILGFLAYDITFVDENGDKLEPNGSVSVSMDYKEAAIPEEVKTAREAGAEVADVTLMHLEENSDGAVKDVVDMVADESQEANVQTTEATEVEAAEFVTESFSTFTLVWKATGRWENDSELNIELIDNKHNPIGNAVRSNVENNKTEVEDLAPSISGYTFHHAILRTNDPWYGGYTRYKITELRYNNQYGSWNDKGWQVKINGYWYTIDTESQKIYFVYTKNSTSGSGGSTTPPTMNEPEHKKYIKYNGNDNYTLTLDVTGKKGETVGADVLLVIDKSRSMGSGYGSYNLMPTVKRSVAQTIVPKLLENKKENTNRLSAISFSSASSEYTKGDISTDWADTNNKQTIINEVKKLSPKGGTNWPLAMQKADEKLGGTAESKNAKYVIFLSDGEPTYYYDEWGKETGDGSSFEQDGLDNAVEEVKSSTYLKNATIYSVYLTDGNTQTRMTEFATKVNAAGGHAVAIDGTNMDAAIQTILNSILTPAYKDVKIEDTLSTYVDFAKENPTFTVTATKDGVSGTLDSSKYSVRVEGKKFTLDLTNTGDLDEGTTYSISVDVKPTTEAYAKYLQDGGYPHTGDQTTDAPDNNTSSGKPGFHSNADNGALLKYKVKGEEIEKTAGYLHPVVQVAAETVEHKVIKNWVNGTENSVQVQLKAQYAAPTAEDPDHKEDVPDSYKSLTTEMRAVQTLQANADATKNWTYTWKDLPRCYYYIDTAGNMQQAEIEYSVVEINAQTDKYVVTYVTTDGTTTITNTAKAKWQIVKVSASSTEVKLPGAEFQLEGEKTYKGVSDSNGVISWTEVVDGTETAVTSIPAGTYTLTETKAPSGYMLSETSWTVTIAVDGGTPVITVGSTTLSPKTSEENGMTVYSYEFTNEVIYSLPSTGGIGTYWYTIGGMLLMMAAALILYKKKKDTK